jgi:hypothetical protein
MSVWADHPFMLGDDEPPAGDGKLGDVLAVLLADEPVGLSCDELALRSHRRRRVVLVTLRTDSRFKHRGRGRGSRWVLAARTAPRARQDGQGRKDTAGSASAHPLAVSDAQNASAVP